MKKILIALFWIVLVIGNLAMSCDSGGGGVKNICPTFSPDGERIAYVHSSGRDPEQSGGNSYISGIYIMDKNGSDKVAVVSDGYWQSQYTSLKWSPDGTKLAFLTSGYYSQVLVCNIDGSNLKSFSGSYINNISWSPDSQYILYSDQDDVLRYSTADLSEQGNLFGLHLSGRSAVLSPDGKKLLYALPSEFPNEVIITDSTNSNPQSIKLDFSFYDSFVWSPDGKSFAFTSGNQFSSNAYVYSLDVAQKQQLGFGVASSWSSQNEIAFYRDSFNAGDIFVVSPDGKQVRQITVGE